MQRDISWLHEKVGILYLANLGMEEDIVELKEAISKKDKIIEDLKRPKEVSILDE
jgi:hypothetical protein